jgi:hypothetical protein
MVTADPEEPPVPRTNKTTKKSQKDEPQGADKKHQRQIYIDMGLIDWLDGDRAEQEAHLKEAYGLTGELSWSAHVGSILERYRQRKMNGEDV